VNKTISGLLKLLFPDLEMAIPDEELEGIVRIALEARRRVKEQQKQCLKTEFRNTHFSYFMGVEGVEQFVSTPELHSDEAIEADPLPPGQDAAPSLFRIEATCGPGSGVKILNASVPPAFRESVRFGEQNLYSQAKGLIGDRDPRSHEFSMQLRAMDADRSGHCLGLPVLVALCGSPMERSTKGGLIIVGSLNLGGSVEMIPNPVAVAELAVEKGAAQLLMPILARRQLLDLPDDMATKVNIVFYAEERAGAKSVFHFDVPGSVAKSTHAGLPWLRYLRRQLGDRAHFWPFDGWEIPPGRSVIVEVYPSLWSRGFEREDRTADQHDAYSVAAWMRRADLNGSLASFFDPCLSPPERTVAQVEGWILGIK
jgi:hypothetical protein